jgi:hypothetical protein
MMQWSNSFSAATIAERCNDERRMKSVGQSVGQIVGRSVGWSTITHHFQAERTYWKCIFVLKTLSFQKSAKTTKTMRGQATPGEAKRSEARRSQANLATHEHQDMRAIARVCHLHLPR